MSAAEQLEDVKTAPPRRDALLEEEAFIEAQLTQSPARTGAKLRPCIGVIRRPWNSAGYVAPASSTHVAMTSIT